MRNVLIAKSSADAGALQLEIVRRGDRFAHLISLVGAGGETIPLLESVEGTPADAAPPSPPLQSVSIETLPDGRRAALLVGMAGRSHWSASIEAVPGEAALIFDIACRSSGGDSMLASTYRLASDHGDLFAAADRSWIEARLPDGMSLVVTATDSTVPSELGLANPTTLSVVPQNGRGKTTIRWKYRVELLT
jgi:hypothetical protein